MATESPLPGKISRTLFDRSIRTRLGRARPEVLVGPRHGVDAGIVDLGGGQVLVATTDPLYVVPAYGWERAAWFALHIVASDAATTGIAPQFVSVDLNLPLTLSDADLAAFWDAFHHACDRAAIAVLTGHTGRYSGCSFPMLGAATVLGTGPRSACLLPGMARPDDRVLVTKGPAIETAGQLAVMFPGRLAASGADAALVAEAQAVFWQMSVVEDARVAASVGVGELGVTAMHDATEFGVAGALVEVAEAAGAGLHIDRGRLPVPRAVAAVCDCFAIDPFAASSEGALVITVRPGRTSAVLGRLADHGIAAFEIGELRPAAEGLRQSSGGVSRPLEYPAEDPFWPALEQALRAEGRSGVLTA